MLLVSGDSPSLDTKWDQGWESRLPPRITPELRSWFPWLPPSHDSRSFLAPALAIRRLRLLDAPLLRPRRLPVARPSLPFALASLCAYTGSRVDWLQLRCRSGVRPPCVHIRTEWAPQAGGERSSRSDHVGFRGSRPEVSRCDCDRAPPPAQQARNRGAQRRI